MIAAPVIGVAPTPELSIAPTPKAGAVTTSFAAIMQAVAPAPQATVDVPGLQLQPAEIDAPAIVEPLQDDAQPVAMIAKTPLLAQIVVAEIIKIDSAEIVVRGSGLPVASKAIAPPHTPSIDMPEIDAKNTKASLDDEPHDIDAIVSELTDLLIFQKPVVEHRTVELPVALPSPEKQAIATQSGAPSPERIVVADATLPKLAVQMDRVEVQISAPPEPRGPLTAAASTADKTQPGIVDRGPAFAPMLVQIARDVMALSADRDVRFNVRPDILGPVAVTIERTDAGPNLRLGVENQAAVQAVRAAEPMLNDPRGNAPFVQVTVDLNAPDQRSRQARGLVLQHRTGDQIQEILTERAPVATGRYA